MFSKTIATFQLVSLHCFYCFSSLSSNKRLGMMAWKQKLMWTVARGIIQVTTQTMEF
jgi:hypothetical protein